jgi:hypothetical protein
VVKVVGAARWLRRLLLALVVALFALSIPWYRRGGAPSELWLGLPDWVAVALLCYAGAALANALAWLLTDIPDEAESDGPPR